ncbi:MAG: hypothetical protein ACRDLY_09430 [Thermoleophilaceae bacterium]
MWELVAALVTGVVGLVAYWAKSLRELKLKYDAELREARLRRYRALWAALEPLAKYARPRGGTISRGDVNNLASALKTWYFRTGGLYLSEDTREAYFALLDVLTGVGEGRWGTEDEGGQLDRATFEVVRVRGSRLRSNLSRDVGTRRPFLLRWEGAPLQARRVEGSYRSEQRAAELALRFSPLRRLPLRYADAPRLALDGKALEVKDWDPWQRAVTVSLDGSDRVLTIEDGRIVEGPRDWDFDADHAPRPAVVWRRS